MADAVESRMKAILKESISQSVNPVVPINRYYRSLNEIYRVAGHCLADKDFEKAFIYYMRFVCLAIEELPNHPSYQGFSSVEKKKANASLQNAIENAEKLKTVLKVKYEKEAADRLRAKDTGDPAQSDHAKAIESRSQPSTSARFDSSAGSSTGDNANLGAAINARAPVLYQPRESDSDRSQASNRYDCTELIVAGNLVEIFAEAAQVNTQNNIETCAILCGLPAKDGKCYITHAIVPKQSGSSESCTTHNEEEIFAFQDTNNLITLGWIHTHPSQTAFLSSIDLHTHCAYQLMLSDSIAIVVAPKYNEVGIFRLSDRGMAEIGACRINGFHPHDNSSALFYYCHEVGLDYSIRAELIDLRSASK